MIAHHGRPRRQREHPPGEWAIIVQDCRGAGVATGVAATYEGQLDTRALLGHHPPMFGRLLPTL